MEETEKQLGKLLVEFYSDMKAHEPTPSDTVAVQKEKSGKQATLLVMLINDIQNIYKPD